ncbi:MAG TPA: MG2 domain-containing protein [Cellvibrio sp.]|nr:MG2 domain-containing protein [Cellvibrio sp.]
MNARLHSICVCVFLLLLGSLLASCDKKTGPAKADDLAPHWETHIADYPKRWVAAEKPLFIRFSHPVVALEKVNQPVEGIVELDPRLPANVLFTADNELRITPVDRLPNNTALKVTLHGEKLLGVEKSLKPFEFTVHSIRQEFDLKIHGLVAQDNSAEKMQFSGELRTADTAELDAVKKILKATINGQPAELEWTQTADRQSNNFVIKNILRTKTEGALHVEWDGAAIESTDKGARDLPIPALTDFKITGVEVVRVPSLYVEVNFSNPINSAQNLQGLVTLAGKNFPVKVDGSRLRIYPENIGAGPQPLVIDSAVQSVDRQAIGVDYKQSLVLLLEKPSVSFVGNSTSILPPADHLTVPFEAVSVDSVQVVAFKVYANNIGHYFQDSEDFNSSSAPVKEGRYLWRKVYRLPEIARDSSQRFNLDLTELMAQHPDGLVRVELQIDRSNSIYNCSAERPKEPVRAMGKDAEDDNYYDEDDDEPSWYKQYYQSEGYWNYSESNNPCSDSYFAYGNASKTARTFMVSNIGLMAKRGSDNLLHVIATGLNDAEPMANADITVFNYQQQVIGKGTTDSYGMVDITSDGTPFYLQAQKDKQIGYLRLPKSEALPTNQFDVSGEHVKAGLKGFIYGERDVWRPGDDIHLTFILQDKDERLPSGYPVTLDFFDPQGKKVFSQTNVTPVNDFYTFSLKTEEAAPTGNWRAVVHVGNRFFDKVIKVEMVTPNRLKIDLTFDEPNLSLANMPQTVHLFSQWLHGATANKLKADSEVKLFSKKTTFEGFNQFVFDDPARSFETSSQKAFEGNLDDEGKAEFELNIEANNPPPGMLLAMFNTRVFEESGNFSTALRSYDVSPYDYWVGVLMPKGDGYYNSISRDKDHQVIFQSLNAKGKAAAKRKLELTVYEISWRWWWDEGGDDIASYVGNSSHTPIQKQTLVSDAQGRATWTLKKDTYEWGRHLIRICDTDSNHCSGQVVYLGWSESNAKNPESATQLMLSSDKEKYQVGDTATVRLPKSIQGRVLLSIENGSRVIEHRWLDLKPNQNEIQLPITADMSPNAYVNMVLLLPHQARKSDAPMRLYGILPLLVEDPATHLVPQMELPEKIRPETSFSVKVSEKSGHAMTYTLAMVDEGLLGLTGFNAPDPHTNFYKREALGVSTWDMFDSVVGAYGASLERVLAIGGSDAAQDAERKRRERRFPPIVKFLGAFTLAAGETRTHDIALPPYMGSVRVMLVAGDTSKVPAYGKVEKTVTVTQPLVLFATLPRVLGPGEEVMLPVNVFVSDANIKKVDIAVEANEIFTLVDNKAELDFAKPGDAITSLRLKVNDRIGKGRIKITAKSGDEVASQEIFIDSRPANPPTVISQSKILAPGEEWQVPLEAQGMAGTNTASLEVSSLPPLNLEKRLSYLISYPHGCVEQTTSSVFPQLHLAKLVALDAQQKADIDKNITAGIAKLASFQTASGGFSYWPGDGYVNDWASSYAGHFLVEAKRAGYAVPSALLDNWVSYQREQARSSDANNDYYNEVAAYRLYTLALADKAELPAMNRLREKLIHLNAESDLSSRWLLGSAYLHMGLKDASKDILGNLSGNIPAPHYSGYTYASDLRNQSLLLLTRLKAEQGNSEQSWQLAEQVASNLGSDEWYSTHSTAWGLLAMSEFASKSAANKDGMKFSVKETAAANWKKQQVQQTFYRQALSQPQVAVRNDDSKANVRVLVSNRGIPAAMDEQASSNGLSIAVNFLGIDNKPLDIQKLPQGTDFVAEVTVSADFNSGLNRNKLEDIALSMVMPSGWQIRNERLEGNQLPKGIDHMDIRDDRVLSYFGLWRDYSWSYRYNERSQTSVTLRVILNASYAGKYYLPAWQAAPMYDEKIHARTKGYWVEVVGK